MTARGVIATVLALLATWCAAPAQTKITNIDRTAAFSPDGRLVAASTDDLKIELKDVASGSVVRTITGHKNHVNALVFSPDGSLLASGDEDFLIKLWNVRTGALVRTLTGHDNYVDSLAFSPDGALLASAGADSTWRLWDVKSGRLLRTVRNPAGWVHGIAFSPDGKRVATASADFNLRIWDTNTGKELQVLKGHSRYVFTVAWAKTGQVASGSLDKTVRLWNLQDGSSQLVGTQGGAVRTVAFSNDGKWLASAGEDGRVHLRDMAGGSELTAPGVTGVALAVDFTPEGSRVLCASDDKGLRSFDLKQLRANLSSQRSQ